MSAPRISLSCFRHLVRAVLLMYVLTLGVAMASTVVKSGEQGMSLICTSTGYKFVKLGGDGVKEEGKSMTHLLDCSLCLAVSLPASFPQSTVLAAPHALSYATRSIPAARLAAIVAAPLPARGPPTL
ncbi:DUF2946 family protein [Undibacterium sp. Di27W]|uniref:DUF2946 family protein n=1 Tax=Undibacterium sp. Di27W TaxID=3413036 RepID=UPI003BF07357